MWWIFVNLICYVTASSCVAAEGHMDCLLLLVNEEQSAEVIDSPDTQGKWVTSDVLL